MIQKLKQHARNAVLLILSMVALLISGSFILRAAPDTVQTQYTPPNTTQFDFPLRPLTQGPGTGQWAVMPSSNQPTRRHENAYVQVGGLFYLMGGRGLLPIQVFNPTTGTWTGLLTPPLRVHHFQAVEHDNLIYVIAAYTGGFPTEPGVPNIYIYDPVTNIWYVGPPIPAARQRGSAGVVVYNDRFYIVGGVQDGHGAPATSLPYFDEYDPETNTWTILPAMPRARDHFHAAIVGDRIYALGGRDTGVANFFFSMIPQVDVYDFTTGAWTTLPAASNIPTPRGGTTAVVLGNEILVIGGEGNAQAYAQTEALNTTTNTWRALANLIQERHGTQAATCNGAVYIVAGGGTQGGSVELTEPEILYFGSAPLPCPFTPITPGTLTAPNTNFGMVTVNTSVAQTITLSNTGGNQGLIISDIDLSGNPEFTLDPVSTMPIIIPPGESVNVNITFSPVTNGIRTANLEVDYGTTQQTATIAISGEGIMLSTATIPPTNTPVPTQTNTQIPPSFTPTLTATMPPTNTPIPGQTNTQVPSAITPTISTGINPAVADASGNNSGQLSVSVADPFVTKIADPPFALPGESVTFIFTVTNPNNAPLTNVQAVDPLPAEIMILSASSSIGTATIVGQSVIFTQSVLNPHETATITINTRVRQNISTPFTIVNEVCASGAGVSQQCARASVLSINALPQTGDTPGNNLYTLLILTLAIVVGLVLIFWRRAVRKAHNLK